MDCGVAALKAIFAGFGVRVSYGRLRDLCHTEVDGTSIDTLEELAVALGLRATQLMVPVSQVLGSNALLPALALIRNPEGRPHFVVLWGRLGPWVQVMDPATGRHWPRRAKLERQLYIHEATVPAADFRAWAGENSFVAPLRERVRKLAGRKAVRLVDAALASDDWHPLARLDAAVTLLQSWVEARALRRGSTAARVLDTLCGEGVSDRQIPEHYWFARDPSQFHPAPAVPSNEVVELKLRGAVLVSMSGSKPPVAQVRPSALARLGESEPSPLRLLFDLLRADGWLGPLTALAGILVVTIGRLLESLMFRGLFELATYFGLPEQRLVAAVLFIGFLLVLLFAERPLHQSLVQIGRRFEIRLRRALLTKLARLKLHYFSSRPASDAAARAHVIHEIRDLPLVVDRVARSILTIIGLYVGLVWLSPATVGQATCLVATTLVVPLLGQSALTERDLRVQTHTGALARFFLDALRGIVPARTHGVGPFLRDAHEGLLREWAEASLASHRLGAVTEGLQALLGFGAAAWLVSASVARGLPPASTLLLCYWALALVAYGQDCAIACRQYPTLRNRVLRLLDPLYAEEDEGSLVAKPNPAGVERAPVHIEFRAVGVDVAGQPLLAEIDLRVEAGTHVAIVGASGSGKTTLLRLLLGWHAAARGQLEVDGRDVTEVLAELRADTVWVDPTVALWNRSLFENLLYGMGADGGQHGANLADVVGPAELGKLVASLPEGLQSALGESGGLVSGGEGQRVRLGRGLMRDEPRLVLLDEPFRGLDRPQRERLLARARAVWRGRTMLCVTHDVSHTVNFDRVIVVAEGRIVEQGPPAELMADPNGAYASLLHAESRVDASWEGWTRLRLHEGKVA